MDLIWLEDFLTIATTRNFSRAAEMRHVTQSAFSRRIRSLEVWLGATLLDRSHFPVTLTDEGRAFLPTAEEILRLAHQARAQFGDSNGDLPATISLTCLHSLAVTFVPRWLGALRPRTGPFGSRILPENFALCVQALVDGGYDFMVTFHHPAVPVPLDAARFPHLTIGADALVAVGLTREVAAWQSAGPLPLLQYSKGSYLGLLTSVAQRQAGAPEGYIAHINENSMAEAMKFMALEGHGVGWLPQSLVAAEIADGRLSLLSAPLPMEIRLYRNGGRGRGLAGKVWRMAEGYSPNA